MRLTRRRALAGLATTALAGCLGRAGLPGGAATSTDEGVRRSLGEFYDAGTDVVTVREVSVRKLIATPDVGSGSHVDVAGFGGDQFVVGTAAAKRGGPPTGDELAVVADGEEVGGTAYRWNTFDPGFDPRPFAIRTQLTDASEAAIRWSRDDGPDVFWTLPDDLVSALGTEPTFEVGRFEVPDSVAPGEPIPVTLDVANTGGRDGTFVAELGAIVLSDVGEVRFEVPRGETVTREFSLTPSRYTPMYGTSGDPLQVVLDWGLNRLETSVGVESDAGTGGD